MQNNTTNLSRDELKEKLLRSLIFFTQIFYLERTGRKFELSYPPGRQSHYIDICEALVRVIKGETNRLIINVPPRYGKAIDVSTPILTKEGWKIADEIKIGDELVGSNGWTKVTGVYPQGLLPAKEIIFNDGQSVICNSDHLWNVQDRYTSTWKTLTTQQIEDTLNEADGRKHWRIPMVEGKFGEVKPFIDPYLFGCWLGDGHTHYAAITSMDEEIIQSFRDKGYEMRLHTHQSAGKAKTYGILGFSTLLRTNNLLKNKHIPESCYLWNKEDRLALLQGLMDTDGTCGKNGQVSFTNINDDIIKGVGFLVNSLGGTYKVYTRICGTKTLNIRLSDALITFRLERKQKYVSKGIKCSPRRFVEAVVEHHDSMNMVCFTVDAVDQLFAVGEGLILTHNTELVIHFVCWALANYPDSNFIYTSYSHTLAAKQTQTIRNIISMPMYRHFFGIELKGDVSAKDNFEITSGGSVYAAGAGGSITGRGAGIANCARFGGCILIDDIVKPDEVTSETIRDSVNEWFYNTLQSRLNTYTTPIIFIGQRLHEDDLAANLIRTRDWESVVLPALDKHNNPLHPTLHSRDALLRMKELSPYNFSSQYQQDPLPAGGGIFKSDWFRLIDELPEIISTFITVDTAETNKSYNDATVFSLWGLHNIEHKYMPTNKYGLVWLDCVEIRIEPKDLDNEFTYFYSSCMQFKIQPSLIAIEKKSTATTLLSVLKTYPGLRIVDINRTKASGSKTKRFLEMQPIIAEGFISLLRHDRHTNMCIEHCKKITANDSHRFDDIADTLYDAIKIALIDNIIVNRSSSNKDYSNVGKTIASHSNRMDRLKQKAYKLHK